MNSLITDVTLYTLCFTLSIVPLFRELKKPKKQRGYIAFLLIAGAGVLGIGIHKIISDQDLQERNRKQIEEAVTKNRLQLERTIMGSNSRPRLLFSTFMVRPFKTFLYWDNSEGRDPAQILYGGYEVYNPRTKNFDAFSLDRIDLPAESQGSEFFYIQLDNQLDTWGECEIDVMFQSLYSRYDQRLVVSRVGSYYAQSYKIYNHRDSSFHGFVDPRHEKHFVRWDPRPRTGGVVTQ
jgi:hypothetical protein